MSSRFWGAIVAAGIVGVGVGAGGLWLWERQGASWLGGAPDGHAGEAADSHGQGAGPPIDAHGHGAAEDEHGHEGGEIVLSEKAIRESGIEVAEAAGGELIRTLALPGEIVLNADRVAHIVPQVAGIVRRVDKSVGDEVRAGEILALLESRELAEGKAEYLAAQQKLVLAEANYISAKALHEQKIMPDLEFLAIEKTRAEASIDLGMAENRLHALGVTNAQLKEVPENPDELALCELRAPFAGTVIQKHCSLGEVLDSQSDAFLLADLETVWANITVYAQDIGQVHLGHEVRLRAESLNLEVSGRISYVSPVLSEATRSAIARVEVPNSDRRWRPGTFVTASVVCDREPVAVLVPTAAIQRLKGTMVVFVVCGEGFEPRVVKRGRTSGVDTEIVFGLEPGERYVVRGAVVLKAEVGKREAVHEH